MSGELTTNENALKEQLIDLVRSVAEPLNAEISRLQQELSDCKAERDGWRASAAEFKGLCEEWQALAEAAEQKFEAASEAYENLQFDAGAERQRANVAEAREKQLRAALAFADQQIAKLEALLEPHIKWDAALASKDGGE